MATTDLYTVVGSLTPTRSCLRFLGGDVDDGVQVDALIAAIVAGNHTKGTITAWIMYSEDTQTSYNSTIFGAGDADAVEFMYWVINNQKMTFRIFDGGADRVVATTTDKVIPYHQWVHVALVQDGNIPRMYVNGVEVALTISTATEPGQWFDDTDAIDGAHIGATDSEAGGAALTNEYRGYISNFKVWSGTASTAALTAEQVWNDYRGVANTTSLLAEYNFQGQAVNQANAGTYNGTIVGGIIYCQANEFASRLTFGCGVPVTADNIAIMAQNGQGFGFVVQQA